MGNLTRAAQDVLAERQRQITAEGWTLEHDDKHKDGSLGMAASCYAAVASDPSATDWYLELVWPWGWDAWKNAGRRRNLVKAAALLLAEIERLDREDHDLSKPPF